MTVPDDRKINIDDLGRRWRGENLQFANETATLEKPKVG